MELMHTTVKFVDPGYHRNVSYFIQKQGGKVFFSREVQLPLYTVVLSAVFYRI